MLLGTCPRKAPVIMCCLRGHFLWDIEVSPEIQVSLCSKISGDTSLQGTEFLVGYLSTFWNKKDFQLFINVDWIVIIWTVCIYILDHVLIRVGWYVIRRDTSFTGIKVRNEEYPIWVSLSLTLMFYIYAIKLCLEPDQQTTNSFRLEAFISYDWPWKISNVIQHVWC